MNNKEVLQAFLQKKEGKTGLRNIQNGYFTYKGRTLQSEFDNIANEYFLINYTTKIASIKNDILYIDKNKYSVTTSKIQHQLRFLANNYDYAIVEY